MHEREEHEWYRQNTGDFECEFHDALRQLAERRVLLRLTEGDRRALG